MANKTYKDMRIRLDAPNSTGTLALTDITAYCNQAQLQRAINLLDDSSLADSNRSVLVGLAGTTISLSGFVNSTIDKALGPLIENATSVTRTIELRAFKTNSTGNEGRFFNGEALPSNIQYSGSVDSLQTWSADFTFDGAVNRTSTALA